MHVYDSSVHKKTLKKDHSRYFTYVFVFLLLSALGGFVYYIVQNSPRLLYHFRENKYSEIERRHAQALSVVQAVFTGAESSEPAAVLALPEVQEFLELAHALQKDHREDAILFFHEATLLAEIFRHSIARDPQALLFLLFRDFIARPVFPKEWDRTLWQQALLAGRKAYALGLPETLAAKLAEASLEIYFAGGRPWWESALELARWQPSVKKLPTWQLVQAGLARELPDFALIRSSYGDSVATFSRAIYYLRSGNSPLGISALRELSNNKADALARDCALYVLGYLAGKEKRAREQLYYYEQIRFAEFAPQNAYFVPEFVYLLRFLGKKAEAEKTLKEWEERKAEGK
ncbi:MAG: hypothetical protein N2Z22_05005 [Turneriella sp.]|nr:hypothetical protein [Leptospiraceae bacterium]MCX7632675.1 hypothetical protein [Turneriella sp.]